MWEELNSENYSKRCLDMELPKEIGDVPRACSHDQVHGRTNILQVCETIEDGK